MDLDEFKITWQAYDQKLDSAQQLGHRLLAIVLRDRSKSTIDKMMRELRLAAALLLGIILLFGAIIAGNPFDYTQPLHYVPAMSYIVIAGTGLYFVIRHTSELRRITLHTYDLYHALTDLIRLRTRHTRLMGRVWMLGILAGSMIMLPAIAQKFGGEWVSMLLIGLLPMGVTALLIGLASLAGVFRDHYIQELREQVDELDELG